MSNPPEDYVMKRLNQSVVQYKHTGCSLSITLCPSNLIYVTVSVRGEVCVGVLILPHCGLGLSITSALQACKKRWECFMKLSGFQIHSVHISSVLLKLLQKAVSERRRQGQVTPGRNVTGRLT